MTCCVQICYVAKSCHDNFINQEKWRIELDGVLRKLTGGEILENKISLTISTRRLHMRGVG